MKSVQDRLPIPSDKLTVANYSKDWLEGIRPSIKSKTYDGYEGVMRVHVIPRLGHIRLSKLEAWNLERFYADLMRDGLSPASVRNYHRRIHSMLEKAVRLGLLVRNVAKLVDLPRQSRRKLPSATPQQVRDFLHVSESHRLGALFRLVVTTGMRQSELLGTSWDKLDLESDQIEVSHSLQKVDGIFQLVETKTSQSVRTLALATTASEALRRHRVRQSEEALKLGPAWNNELNLVFTTAIGTPLDRTNVGKREFRRLLKSSSLPQNLRFHDLRHIAATFALGQGVPLPVVSQMLGHADASTTLRVYSHVIPGAQRQAADALDAVLAV